MKPIHYLLIAVTALLLLALGSYLYVDQWLFQRFLENQPTLHENMWLSPLRELGKAWLSIWLLLIMLLITRQVRPTMAALIAMLLIIPLVTPAKFITGRVRPAQRIEIMQQPQLQHDFARSESSFPSGDTATAFAIATALTPYVVRASVPASRAIVPILFTLASLVGMMRLTVMKHYVSDVLAGAAFGIVAGYIAWLIIEKHPNLRPHLYTTPLARAITLGLILALPFLAMLSNVNPITLFLKQYWMLSPIFIAFVLYYHRRASHKQNNLPESTN